MSGIVSNISVHNVGPADVGVHQLKLQGRPTVSLTLGQNVSIFITDLAVLDALHEATTQAYELLAEGVVAA